MKFDVMTSFAKKRFSSHHTIQVTIMMVKNVAGLVSGTKFKKNAVSLHGILPTHVYTKFITD